MSGLSQGIYTGLGQGIYEVDNNGLLNGLTTGIQGNDFISNTIVRDGLVLHLDANNSGSYLPPYNSNIWVDISGKNNNSTLNNGPVFNNGNGGSIVFDGSNDYVVSPDLNISGNAPITISFWCNHLSNQNGDVVSLFYGTCGSPLQSIGLYYRPSSNYVRFTTYQSSPGDYDTSFIKDFNTWHHWCVVYSNNKVLVYRDGVADSNGLQNKPINFTTTKLYFGGVLCGYYSNIKVGSVFVYNRELTQIEIIQNYNATKSRF
jgi:hypothetical protein